MFCAANIPTTASLQVPLYTATNLCLRSSFRWGEGDLGGEVKATACQLYFIMQHFLIADTPLASMVSLGLPQ
jgi:hypothetical protein